MPAKRGSKRVKKVKSVKTKVHTKESPEVKENTTLKENLKDGNESSIRAAEKIVDKAVLELSKWNDRKLQKEQDKSGKLALFDEDSKDLCLYLQATSLKFFAKKQSLKPKGIKLKHSINNLDLDDGEPCKVCVFVKDNTIDESLLEKIEAENIPHLEKIIPAKELKTTYKSFEARRKLWEKYELFLSDDYLITTLPKLLGKRFYGSAKFPIPIKVYSKDKTAVSVQTLKNQILKVLHSTYFIPPMGVNISLKLGSLKQDRKNLHDNLNTIINYLSRFPIRILQLKLEASPSIPIYVNRKVHSDEDVIGGKLPVGKDTEPALEKDDSDELSLYERGLIELAFDEEEARKVIDSKRAKHKKRKHIEEEGSSSQDLGKKIKV